MNHHILLYSIELEIVLRYANWSLVKFTPFCGLLGCSHSQVSKLLKCRRKAHGVSRNQAGDGVGVDTGYSDSMNQSDQFVNGFKMHTTDASNTSTSGKRKSKSQKNQREIAQYEESKEALPGSIRQPNMKASKLLSNKEVRTNKTKKIGHVPGVEVGDIFFFRMELCLVGLHSQSMAGIDYIGVKVSGYEDPVAVSIVSSGAYEDDGNNGDMLIYTGQGGLRIRLGQAFDQKT
ncbi:hypothetical protein Leryth_016543 [Lithospermum erythrorhizon]|nr:hypothetical protein Leryth_016543 [Lithospermum erythrorhizon]